MRASDRAHLTITITMVVVFFSGWFLGGYLAREHPATCASIEFKGIPMTICWQEDIRPDLKGT